METITIHPENKEQFAAIEAVLKEMKIPFEKGNIMSSEIERETSVLRDFGNNTSSFLFWTN